MSLFKRNKNGKRGFFGFGAKKEQVPDNKPHVFIYAYTNNNLGDDLFIRVLCKRYPDIDFILTGGGDRYVKLMKLPNLRHGMPMSNEEIKEELAINIGGSLFMEQGEETFKELDDRINACRTFGRWFLISPSFGPYKTEEYFEKCKTWFGSVDDVCFRDRYSYEKFSDVNTVRYAPDVAFCMDLEKKPRQKRILINCMEKFDGKIGDIDAEKFINKLAEVSAKYLEMGYEVAAVSFSTNLGDMDAAKKISKACGGKVKTYGYDGSNIAEILELFTTSEYVIASRFHASVIALRSETPVFPIIYSQKTKHMLDDCGFPYEKATVSEFCDLSFEEIDKNRACPAFDVTEYSAQAQQQFKALDAYLKEWPEDMGKEDETVLDPSNINMLVSSVIFKNDKKALKKSIESFANAVRVYRERVDGALNVTYTCGDASPEPVYSPEEIKELQDEFGEWFEFKYRWFGFNSGYGKGHNLLTANTTADYICIINPDIIVEPKFFINMLEPFKQPGVGMSEARQCPIEHQKVYDEETKETGWCVGACFIIRRDVFEKVKGYDTKTFFMYCEDVDISWRTRLLGYKLIYQPLAAVFHAKRISLAGKSKPSDLEWLYSSLGHLLMAHKWSDIDRTQRLLAGFSGSGFKPQMDAADKFREIADKCLLPRCIDPDHKVAECVDEVYYSENRFKL